MTPASYAHLLRHARRHSRRTDAAEDLLQTVLLAAHKAGRGDASCPENRRWMMGALRNHGKFDARSAIRRRAREANAMPTPTPSSTASLPHAFLETLPPSLRHTAFLALGGHTRAEIAFLLRLPDTALRQRFAQIKRRWNAAQHDPVDGMPALSGHLPYGLIRQALHHHMDRSGTHLGSHDPDGHLFLLSAAHKTAGHGNL